MRSILQRSVFSSRVKSTRPIVLSNACSNCLWVAHYSASSTTARRRTFYTDAVETKSNGPESFPSGSSLVDPLDTFSRRHIGPSLDDVEHMLKILDPPSQTLDYFVKEVLPANILSTRDIDINGQAFDSRPEGYSETEILARLKEITSKNKVVKSYIGCGYAGTKVPEVIKRNFL